MAIESGDDKTLKLKALGAKRQAETFEGYSRKYPRIGDYHKRAYETEWVSPFTKSAHNVETPLFLVLHDWWADQGGWPISGAFDSDSATLGYGRTAPTNVRLKKLLAETYGKNFQDVFITNLWPFVRPRDGDPSQRDYDRAFQDYCWRQVQIVSPPLVVCFGDKVWRTFCRNLDGPSGGVGTHFSRHGSEIWYQSHPGARPVNATESDMLAAWAQMKAAVNL